MNTSKLLSASAKSATYQSNQYEYDYGIKKNGYSSESNII